jgi:predicted N-acyltransferase
MSVGRRETAVEVVDGIAKVSRESWNGLVSTSDSPFLDWDWLSSMEDSRSATRKTGWAPYHLIVRDGAGGLLAACPLYLKSHSQGEFIFDHGWAEAAHNAGLKYFPKLLVGVPFTPHSGRRFLISDRANRPATIKILGSALVSLCRENNLSSVHVNFCEADEALILKELGFMERWGYQYHWNNASYLTFDDYLLLLKSKRRYAVRHELSVLIGQGVEIKAFVGDEIDDSIFEPMFEIYRSTIEKLYWGRQYLTREFFDLMRDRFKRFLCFICAFRGSELVAATFNVQKAGVLCGRYWGCFRDLKFLHFNVCYYAAIDHCIKSGIGRFEPGAGGEYKWLRGFDPALTRSMHYVAHPGLRTAVDRFLAAERREVERWIEVGRHQSQLKPMAPSNEEGESPNDSVGNRDRPRR